jgi:serine/threonine protein kinase
MAAPPTSDAFVELLRKSELIESERLDGYLEQQRALAPFPSEPQELATVFIRDGLLTYFQAMQLLKGKYRGFTIGKYKLLERLGASNNSSVFLCEHCSMRRKVALKILPLAKAEDPHTLARFQREARAAGALDHPNIVRTYDNDQENGLHFLVMEYVDGCSLQNIVENRGPLEVARAAAYIRQASVGLQHLHRAGLIHRDIKPGNLLLERRGTVKILDLGLARFFRDHKDMLTQQYTQIPILGTADYLSPEQALNSHDIDTRADIYSLGATLYFLLSGRPPFVVKAIGQKLLAHITKEPTPLHELRPEVPEGLSNVVAKMMAKDPEQRYHSAAEVVLALAPWTEARIAPPPLAEMPQLCAAAQSAGSLESSPVLAAPQSASSLEISVQPATAISSVPNRRKREEPEDRTPHSAFDRHPSRAKVRTARAKAAQVVGRSGSKSGTPGGGKPPASSSDLPLRPSASKSPPAQGDRAPGQRRVPETVNSISGMDTRTDLHKKRQPSSEPPAAQRHSTSSELRWLAAICLLTALAAGIAFHLILSKPSAPSAVEKPLSRVDGTSAPK